jgi:dihydrofolate synthase/folylpolyglutamate synthase
MTYRDAMNYIHAAGMSRGEPGLGHIRALLSEMGQPQNRLRFVHVAGTNGKGSTSAMVESVLRAAGYKTGLFTSPYLHRFNERIRVSGESIPDDDLAEIVGKIKPIAEALGGGFSEFELDTAIGFEYFARRDCDIVVLEVGLGGRLDPTNVIACPDCAVITNIGLDHTAILGDTVEKIAGEKAGIIKPGAAVALYPPETSGILEVFERACREMGASLRVADSSALTPLSDSLEGQVFLRGGEELRLPLLGSHQLKNAAVVLEAIDILREKGYKISADAVRSGLARVRWPARFELLRREPDFVVDGGHNEQCARAVAENLRRYFPDKRRILLLGIMADKDVDAFLDAVAPVADEFVCVRPNSPRSLSAADLGKKLERFAKPVKLCGSVDEGIDAALEKAGREGVACAVGSLYMAGDVRSHFGLE